MDEIHLEKGLGVDDEQLRVFEEKVKYVLSQVNTDLFIATMMGIEKGNWSRYLSGKYKTTPEIIAEFEDIFRNILRKRGQSLAENSTGYYPTEEGPTPYSSIEAKLTELAENAKQIAAGQKRLEEKIDLLLPKKP